MRIAIYGLAVVSLLGLQGCSDPKQPSEKNFAKVIGEAMTGEQECVWLGTKLPVRLQVGGWDREPVKQLRALSELGLVKISKTTETVPNNGFFKFPKLPDKVFEEYVLTENGKKYYVEYETGGGLHGVSVVKEGSKLGKFCYAGVKLDEIVKWTEPSDMEGLKVSVVTATYGYVNVAEWAKSNIAKEKLGVFSRDELNKQPLTMKVRLELTNQGWGIIDR